MNRICWWLVDIVSRMLEPYERDAVRGDFSESNEHGMQALFGLLGLVLRRQVDLWTSWRPWLALLGLVVPVAVFYGRFAMTIRSQGARIEEALPLTHDIGKMVCGSVLGFSWAWIGGFALGSLVRRSAWLYAALFCLVWWQLRGMPLRVFSTSFPLALFLLMLQMALILSFLWGVHEGVRLGSLRVSRSLLFAAAFTILTLVIHIETRHGELAFEFWNSGLKLGDRLAWEPHPLAFAVILWQFGFLTVTTNWLAGRDCLFMTAESGHRFFFP